jgi:hypothetical protein
VGLASIRGITAGVVVLFIALGAAPARALAQPAGVVVSADGLNLYDADGFQTYWLRLDPESGKLALMGSYQHGGSVELSPDGRHLYVVRSGEPAGIDVFARDQSTGALTFVGRWEQKASNGSQDLEFGDDRTAYLSSGPRNELLVLNRDPETGRLELRRRLRNGEDVPEGLAYPSRLTVTHGWLFVDEGFANSDDLSAFRLSDHGDPTLDLDGFSKDSAPAGSRAFATGAAAYAMDPGTGRLWGPLSATDDSGLYRGLYESVAVAGASVYSTTYYEARLSQFEGPPDALKLRHDYFEGRDGKGIVYPHSLATSPDGHFVFLVSGPPSGPAGISVFRRDPATGDLTFTDRIEDFGARGTNTPPSAPAALKINGGDEYTNDPEVLLTVEDHGFGTWAVEIANRSGRDEQLPVEARQQRAGATA